MGGASSGLFLVMGVSAFLFNRAYTHYGSMENPDIIWKWAVFLYKGKYIGITNICLALTYLSIGTFFAISRYNPKSRLCVLLIILGAVEMHFEKYKGVALGVPVIAFGLFPLIKNWNLDCSWISFRWLRKMSTLIYFVHGIVVVAISKAHLGIGIFSIWCVIIVCCVMLAALLLELSKVNGMQWIKKLY